MIKFITNILETVLTIASIIIILTIGAIAYRAAPDNGLVGLLLGLLGLGLGALVAAIVLGIPITLIRINENLEGIKDQLAADVGGQTPHPDTHIRCPDCKELVRKEARVCKFCGCKLTPDS